MDSQKQAARLVEELDHLGNELRQLTDSEAGLQHGSPAWNAIRRTWKELNDTYSSKEQQLIAIAGPRNKALAGALAFAEASWATSERQLLAEGVLPLSKPVPSAVGGARYILDVAIQHYMLEAFLKALEEMGGAVAGTRPMLGSQGQVFDTTFYTISLVSVDDQFEVARLMVLNYYANKFETQYRG